MKSVSLLLTLASAVLAVAADPRVVPAVNTPPSDTVGERHYCFEKRRPARPATLNFEDISGWTIVQFGKAEGSMERTREAQIWSRYVAKISFRQQAWGDYVECRPPEPILLPWGFDCVNVWVRADQWYIRRKPTMSPRLRVRIRDASGELHTVNLGHHPWKDWFLAHRRVVRPPHASKGTEFSGGDGNGWIDHPAVLEAIIVDGPTAGKMAALYLDHVSFYREELKPLGVRWPSASHIFPTTPDTILPTFRGRHSIQVSGDSECARFVSRSDDGVLVYQIDASKPGFGGVTAQWRDGAVCSPLVGGGPELASASPDEVRAVDDPGVEWTKLDAVVDGDAYRVTWRMACGARATEGTTTYRLKGKSLAIDVAAPGGEVAGVRFGRWVGAHRPKLVRVPFLTLRPEDPNVLCAGDVFVSAFMDWYVTDASTFYGGGRLPSARSAQFNGGSRYLPKTDGKRNDVRECIFLTVSPHFDEVLPNIPNPANPYAKMMVERAWWDVGAARMDMIQRMYRWGLRGAMMQYNGVIWDRGTDFTRRSFYSDGGINVGAGKMRTFSKGVRDLGYLFGLHTNYCIVPPGTHRCWKEDLAALDSRGEWQTGWGRCYSVKPSLVHELQSHYTALKDREFGTCCEYSDQTTAFHLGRGVDFDVRVPMAGKLRGQFEAYGRFLWRECEMIDGPVISEGPQHWVYAGLAAGNYGQLVGQAKYQRPLLVDFDLLKMHTKQCDTGMGIPSMFYGRDLARKIREAGVHSDWFDRWIAWTLAFGHIAQLSSNWGHAGLIKMFYLVQPAQQHYALVPVKRIRYFDGEGLVSTSDAIRNGAIERNQVCVDYSNGLTVWVNASWAEDWLLAAADRTWLLPPTGYLLHRPRELLEYSAMAGGRRVDYVETRSACYLDSRGQWANTPVIATDGAAACFMDDKEPGVLWIVPALDAKTIVVQPRHFGLTGGQYEVTAYDFEKSAGEASYWEMGDKVALAPVKGVAAYRMTEGAGKLARSRTPMPEPLALDLLVSPRRWVGVREDDEVRAKVLLFRRPGLKEPVELSLSHGQSKPKRLSLSGGDLPMADISLGRPSSSASVLRVTAACGREALTRRFRLVGTPVQSLVEDLAARRVADEWGYCRRGQNEVTCKQKQGPGYARFLRGFGECGGKRRLAFAAPPVFDGPPHGYVFGELGVTLPREETDLTFGIGINDSSPSPDGVVFSVTLTDEAGRQHALFKAHHGNGLWRDERTSLARFAGQWVRLRFQTDCGPAGDASNDSARWAEPRIVRSKPAYELSLEMMGGSRGSRVGDRGD